MMINHILFYIFILMISFSSTVLLLYFVKLINMIVKNKFIRHIIMYAMLINQLFILSFINTSFNMLQLSIIDIIISIAIFLIGTIVSYYVLVYKNKTLWSIVVHKEYVTLWTTLSVFFTARLVNPEMN